MANPEAIQCRACRRASDLRRRLAVPLFDLSELPGRPAKPRKGRAAGESARHQAIWTPEHEARQRLAALLAEAAGASPGAGRKPALSWKQLVLPGWEDHQR